jgi:hypothetical protein
MRNEALKESGQLQERHVLMAMDFGMSAGLIVQEHARAEDIAGCGADRFVQILPWFGLKPRRFNDFNSQILFQRSV